MSTRRIVAVAAGLAAAGALLGAVASVVTFLIGTTIQDGRVVGLELRYLVPAALVGLGFGAVLMPLLGFLLMRRVPLRWAFAALVGGFMLGGVPGWLLFWQQSLFVKPLAVAVAVILFLILLLRLRFEVRQTARRSV